MANTNGKDLLQAAREAAKAFHLNAEIQSYRRVKLGRLKTGTPIFEVPGHPRRVYITFPDGSVSEAMTEIALPHNYGLPLKVRFEHNLWVVKAIDGTDERVFTEIPSDPSGTYPHSFLLHTDVPTEYTGSAGAVVRVSGTEDGLVFEVIDSDDVPEGASNLYFTDERAQDALAAALVDSPSIDVTYTDGSNQFTLAVIDEYIQDLIGAMVSGNTETNIAVTYDDVSGKIDFVVTTNAEEIQDIVGAMVPDTTSIDATYDDGAGTLSLAIIDEYVQDVIGAMLSGNTETNIAVTYDDTNGKIDFVVSTDTEVVQDIVGALIVDSSSIDATYNDGAGSLSLAVIDEYLQDVIGAMMSGNVETGITVTYDDTNGKIDFDAQTAGDARYGRLASANTWSLLNTFTAGATLGGNAVASAVTLAINTAAVQNRQLSFQTAGVNRVIMRLTNDAESGSNAGSNLQLLFRDDAGAALITAFSAARSTGVFTWGAKQAMPIVAASTSSGLRVEDDGGNLAIFVKDGGLLTGFGGVTNPTTGWHFQRPTNRQELKVQQFVAGQDLSRLMFTDSTDALIFSFETAAGAYRHTFADGFVPSDNYTALYTGLAQPIYLGTNDLIRQTITSAGLFGFGTRSPQGMAHFHDGTSGWLHTTKLAVTNVTQTIIPDGTGDVTKALTGFFVASDAGGGVANALTLLPGDTLDVSVGALTLRFTVTVGGAFTVIRQSGTGTATVTLDVCWH